MAESSGRLLPELSESNDVLLEVGRGRHAAVPALLRRAASCATRRLAVCPYCHSTEWAPAEVSGRAVVAGFTINEHTWMPSFPPPYVIAIVAIEEDDRVRLTTNIVNCDPADVFVGMKVQVLLRARRRRVDPAVRADRRHREGPVPGRRSEDVRDVRPMPKNANKFEDQVAITGIGMSQVGRRLMVDPITLTVEAAKQAIADAGLEPSTTSTACRPTRARGSASACRKVASPRSKRSCASGRRGSTAASSSPARPVR